MKTKLVFNVAINILLLTVYAFFFGQDSIKKYMKKNIVIVTQEVIPSSISPPGEIVSIIILKH